MLHLCVTFQSLYNSATMLTKTEVLALYDAQMRIGQLLEHIRYCRWAPPVREE